MSIARRRTSALVVAAIIALVGAVTVSAVVADEAHASGVQTVDNTGN